MFLLSIGCSTSEACQTQADHFSTLVTWATIIVAIGVALEGVELIHDGIVWIKRSRLKKKELLALKELAEIFPSTDKAIIELESNSGHSKWVNRFTRIGLILVVAGVVGEWIYGARLEDAHNAVHKYDMAKLTEAERQAGDAKMSAEGAANAASRAQVSADAADAALSRVQKQVSGVEKEADAVEFAVSARLVQDVDGLTADLRNGFKGQLVVFKSYSGNEEGFWLCSQLVDVARKAELNAQDMCATEQIRNIPTTDLLITAPTIEEAQKLSTPLKKPRRVTGYFVSLNEGPIRTVFVGIKPMMPLWLPDRSKKP